jgi:hypothetical protein
MIAAIEAIEIQLQIERCTEHGFLCRERPLWRSASASGPRSPQMDYPFSAALARRLPQPAGPLR